MKLTIPLSLPSLTPPVPNTSSLMNNCYIPLPSLHLSAPISSSSSTSSSSLCPPLSSSSVLLSIRLSLPLSLSLFPPLPRPVSLRSLRTECPSHSPFSSLLFPLLSSPPPSSSLHLSHSSSLFVYLSALLTFVEVNVCLPPSLCLFLPFMPHPDSNPSLL